jgi:hypothetical protein
MGPEFENNLGGWVFLQNTVGASQCMKLISLNIQFDQVYTIAGSEVIVQGYDIDRYGFARIAFGQVRAVIDI